MTKFILGFVLPALILFGYDASAQRGYYDAPYKRYEADLGTLTNAAATPKSYKQSDLQCEASDQVCVNMTQADASVEWTLTEADDGLVIRYSVPDGESAVIGVYDGQTKITSLTLTSKWSWEYLWSNGDPNNIGITNKNPRMRFDEIRYKLPNKLSKIKLVRESGNLMLDFIEMEPVPAALTPPAGAAVFSGNGSALQAFIDANGSKTIFVPAGVYNIATQLYFGVDDTKLVGAGMWYTQLNFTETKISNGGLRANAKRIGYSDLYLTSDMTTRTNGYSGILGVYTPGSTISRVWVEHCATGAWIAQYVSFGPAFADGFVLSDCRFRNTYADGINLCKGTSNAIVEHCNFRNNGDDGMAVWSAEGLECINNTFRYNTVENVWRAAGIGLYGGKDNKFYNILIRDNLEMGITVNNFFAGVGFNEMGMHTFHDLTVTGCGTFNDTNNKRVGAINISGGSSAGTKVQNIRFFSIDINGSKCDAIHIVRASGTGIINLSFEHMNVNGTGKEYPNNNVNAVTTGVGYVAIIENNPIGGATYCDLNTSDLGGSSNGTAFNTVQIGNFSWTGLTGCDLAAVTGVKVAPADTSIAGGLTFQLVPKFTPANATNKSVTYSTDNPAVAMVTYDGLVTTLSKGQAIITVSTQEGNFTATSTIHVTSDPFTVYRIENRWQNTYLYDAGDRVKYASLGTGNTYLWQLVDVDGVKEIKNYSTGNYMNIENQLGYVQCSTRTPGTLSSRWSLEDAGSGYVRLESLKDTTNYISVEHLTGQAECGIIGMTWWSAMWSLEPVIIMTSVASLENSKSTGIYPNPSTGDFNWSVSHFTRNEKVSIVIYNLAGQALYTTSCTADSNGNQNVRVSVGTVLSPGNYYIVAKGNSKFISTKLVICK